MSFGDRNFGKGVAQRLRSYRQSCGLKAVEFAKKLEISQGTLSDLENSNAYPSFQTLEAMARNTDINIHWLLIGEGSMFRGQTEEVPAGRLLGSQLNEEKLVQKIKAAIKDLLVEEDERNSASQEVAHLLKSCSQQGFRRIKQYALKTVEKDREKRKD